MKKQPNGPVWGYAASDHPEGWHGACATREEAIAGGRSRYGAGESFFVVEGEWLDPAQFFDANDVVEQAKEQLYANAHEDAELELSADAEKKLDALLDAWCKRHVRLRAWMAAGEPEKVEARPVTLTLAKIEELARLEREATPGPWTVWAGNPWHCTMVSPEFGKSRDAIRAGGNASDQGKNDVAFVAALRNDAPSLIEAARDAIALRELLAEAREFVNDYENPYPAATALVARIDAALSAGREGA